MREGDRSPERPQGRAEHDKRLAELLHTARQVLAVATPDATTEPLPPRPSRPPPRSRHAYAPRGARIAPPLRERLMPIATILGAVLVVASIGLAIRRSLEPQEPVSPVRWIVSHVDAEEKPIVDTASPPTGDNFVDAAVFTPAPAVKSTPVAIVMTLPACQSYDHYRFWVGPHGADSTTRQPILWTMSLRDSEGVWVTAAAENKLVTYRNNNWYAFPLNNVKGCIRDVKMQVTRVVEGRMLRLYQMQFYQGSFVEKVIDVLK